MQNQTEDIIFLPRMFQQIADPKIRASQRSLEKIKSFLILLQAPKINLQSLQAQCFHGIPDECRGLRSLCWKLLLEYLPTNPYKWKNTLESHRKNYLQFISEYYTPLILALVHQASKIKAKKAEALRRKQLAEENKETKGSTQDCEEDEGEETEESVSGNTTKNDKNKGPPVKADESYKGFDKDEELWDDVVKDTKRTRSEMDFFQRETPQMKPSNGLHRDSGPFETHNDVLSRILFIYAKLNPGVGYIQGMNEVLAPIYYCFCLDQDPDFEDFAETDAFFCFSILMGEIQDRFIKGLDSTEAGIQAKIMDLNRLLKRLDIEMWEHLERYRVNPQFYTLRWLMLLLTQEFEIIDVLRLWDSILSHPKKLVFLNYLCIGMLFRIRERILGANDFADLIEMLQKQVAEDLDEILALGAKLYQENATKNDEKVPYINFTKSK